MPKQVLRKEAQELLDAGAQVLDVLELRQYRQSHLPGAVHIYLSKVDSEAPARLDPGRPLVVYCSDFA